MRTDDREKMVEALGPMVPSGWRIVAVGPDTSSAKENGVRLFNGSSDTVLLIGVVDDVRRADRVLKVSHNGKWVTGIGSGPYKGRGWIERAMADMLEAVSAIDAVRTNHQALLVKSFDKRVPVGWIMDVVGELFSKNGGVSLTNGNSDMIRVFMVDDSVAGLSYGMRVFFRGRWSKEMGHAMFSGTGWHDAAVDAVIEAASKIGEARA